jgi:uncharacterized protein (DUF58 family)
MTRALGAALLGGALVLAGAAFDSPSLHVPGVALLLLGGGAAAWVAAAATGAALHRAPGPPTIEEERPYPLRLEIRGGLVAPPGGELDEPLLGRPLRLRAVGARPVRVDVTFSRRGRRALAPSRMVVRDPLGLARRELRSEPASVLVLPRVEPVLAEPGAGAGALGHEATRLAADSAELELDSLRPYRPGAPASRIHWPTVARSGTIMERRMVADADARPLVILDPRRAASEEALDRAVRAAASLCVELARAGGCAMLLPGDRRAAEVDVDLRAWHPLHVRLALVEAADGAPPAARIERRGALFWVTAAPGGSAPTGLARAAASVKYLVVPAAAAAGTRRAGGVQAFSVAGCAGYRVGRAGARRAA